MRRIFTTLAKPFTAIGRAVAAAWNRERVLILTAAGIAAQTALDAINEGADTETIVKAVIYALGGLIARQGVWSQNSVEDLKDQM